LRLTIAETAGAATDAHSLVITATFPETTAAPADGLTLKVSGTPLGDSAAAPTDAGTLRPTWRVGANVATNEGPQNWVSPTNAQGLRNGTDATIADASALATATAPIRLAYPDAAADLQTFTIQTVKLYYLASYVAGVLPVGMKIGKIEYRIGAGAYVLLENALVSFDSRPAGSPKVFDITTAMAGSWANVNGIEVRVTFGSGLTETSSAALDAVDLEVIPTTRAA